MHHTYLGGADLVLLDLQLARHLLQVAQQVLCMCVGAGSVHKHCNVELGMQRYMHTKQSEVGCLLR